MADDPDKLTAKYERLLKRRHWPESNEAARRAVHELLRKSKRFDSYRALDLLARKIQES